METDAMAMMHVMRMTQASKFSQGVPACKLHQTTDHVCVVL